MKHLVLGGVLLFTLFSFSASFGAEAPENCKSYFDGCNNCSRQSIGSDLMCTMMWCETPTTPVCREYFPNTSTGTLACPEIYAPVCAQPPMPPCPAGMACIQVMPQPKTYFSECVAKSEKATVLYTGACKDDAPITQCTGKYDPVCAKDPHRACPDGAVCLISDLRTYANECKAKADGATIVSVGACKGDFDANPPRACDLDALICPDGSAIGRTGPDCQFDCSAHQLDCPSVRDAVCGSDGKTYGNVCLAGGKEIAYKGKCLSTKTQASIRSILVGAIEKKTAHISNPGILATILENVAEKSDRLGDQATSELRAGVYHFASKVIYEYLQKKVYEPYLQSLKETIFPGEGGHTLEFIWNGNHSVGIQNHYQDMISVTQVQVGVKDQNLSYTIEE